MEETGSGDNRSQGDGLFPEEIVFEILARLPAKSLCRFRCVSPQWRSIINDPHFVSSHLVRSAARPRLLICVDEYGRVAGRTILSIRARLRRKLFFSTEDPTSSGDLRRLANFHISIDTGGCYVSQPVGGLICLGDKDKAQVINPATGESITLRRRTTFSNHYYLGYDPTEKKYKIVDSSTFILTLGEKEWRKIDPGIAGLSLVDCLCVNGVMHMVGVTGDAKGFIMLFDVKLETFKAIPFPTGFSYHSGMELMDFGGRIAFLDLSMIFINYKIRLWTLENHDERVLSYKNIALPPSLLDVVNGRVLHYFVGGNRAGEVVFSPLRIMESFDLYVYRLEDDSLRKIQMSGVYEHFSKTFIRGVNLSMICGYVETPRSLQEYRID